MKITEDAHQVTSERSPIDRSVVEEFLAAAEEEVWDGRDDIGKRYIEAERALYEALGRRYYDCWHCEDGEDLDVENDECDECGRVLE